MIFDAWEMHAIGGGANPTINSQGNRYTAPGDSNAKEVTIDEESGNKRERMDRLELENYGA